MKTSVASRDGERKPPFVDMVQNSTWKGRCVQKNVAATDARLCLVINKWFSRTGGKTLWRNMKTTLEKYEDTNHCGVRSS